MSMIRRRLQNIVLAGALMSAVIPAAASAQGSDAQSPRAADSSGFSNAAGSVVASRDGFELRSLDDSFHYGGQADYTLRVLPDGDFIKVQVQVFASDMRACLVELGYDDSYWQLVDGKRGDWPGNEQPLQLSVPEMAGSLHHGAVLPRPQKAQGVTGTFELLEARFRPVGQYSAVKGVSSPDVASSGLSAAIGDYNADGQVNLADMLRVSEYWGQRLRLPAGHPVQRGWRWQRRDRWQRHPGDREPPADGQWQHPRGEHRRQHRQQRNAYAQPLADEPGGPRLADELLPDAAGG